MKRIHEYKRQLLNALYCIYRYNTIKAMTPAERARVVPRVTIFGGKSAPGYDMAKRIVSLKCDSLDILHSIIVFPMPADSPE